MRRGLAVLALVAVLAAPALAGPRRHARVIVRSDRASQVADLLIAADGRLVEPLEIPALKAVVLEGKEAWASLDADALAQAVSDLARSNKIALTYIETCAVSRAEGSDCCGTDGVMKTDPQLAAKRARELAWPRRVLGLDKITGADARGTLVALLDTGIDQTHPALKDSIVEAESLLDDDADPQDKNGHGTSVAGVLVAKGNAEDGFAPRGVAPGARLLSIKVMDDRGTGDVVTLARGIVRAADKNARVVLVSAGVAAPSPLLADAVAYARSRGAIVVAAAGNETLGRALYPARSKGALAVAASRDGHRLALNTPLDGAIDLAAPGDEILTTLPQTMGGRGVMAGSSMSAAFVAGTAALAFGRGADADSVLRILRSARHPFPTLAAYARFLPIGELDAALALSRLDSQARTLDAIYALPSVARSGSLLTVRALVRASGGRLVSGGVLRVNGVDFALPSLPADGSAVAVEAKIPAPAEGHVVASLDDDVRTLDLPVARGAKVSKLQIIEMSLDSALHVVVENQGELSESVSVSASAERDFLRGTGSQTLEPGARAAFDFELPSMLPEVCRFEAHVQGSERRELAAGRLDVRLAGKDPRPVRPLYQQSSDVDLIADAPWRLEPDRAYVPVLVFAPSKGDSGRGIDLSIDKVTMATSPDPATPGTVVYDYTRGNQATSAAGVELYDEDGSRLIGTELFQGQVLQQNGRHEVFHLPRATFGVASRPAQASMQFLDVKMSWTAHRSAWFGLTIATDTGDYHKVLGVNFASKALPVLPGAGRYFDTHVHTIAEWYITSPYDLLAPKKAYGGPITMIREAAYAIGITSQLDPGQGRIITTDHSCFYNEQDPDANDELRRVQFGPSSPGQSKDAAGNVKHQLDRFREIFGVTANEEVAFDQPHKVFVIGLPMGAHMLTFRAGHMEERWNARDGGSSPNKRAFGTGTLPLSELLTTLSQKAPDQNADAFLYSAHAFSSDQGWDSEHFDEGLELKPTLTGRRSGETINTKTQNFVLKGHQLWNGRAARSLPPSKIDWYDLNPWVDSTWSKGYDNDDQTLEEGLREYHKHLSQLMRYEPDAEPGKIFIRKLYVAAGSDAHGDFNYTEIRLATPLNLQSTFGVDDSAFAKARTYVLEDGVPGNVDRGLNALARGNSVITDGPLAKLAFDADGHFDSTNLAYHAGASTFEDEDGKIGGGGAGPDGARTALVVAKSEQGLWRYRYEDAPEKAVSALELYKIEQGVAPKTRRIQPKGYDAPAPSATLPLKGADQDNVVAADANTAGAFDKLTAVQLGAFAGSDPAKGYSPDATSRCYVNPIWVAPVAVVVSATPDLAAGKFPKGSITVRFTFPISMKPLVYKVEVKPLDASGKTTDRSVAGAELVPANASGWSNDKANNVNDAVFEVSNADEVSLAQFDWPSQGRATFVVYFRDVPQDAFGNPLNSIAATFEAPRVGNPPVSGTTNPGSTSSSNGYYGGGGGGGGCEVAGEGRSASAILPLFLLAVVLVSRRRFMK